LILRHENAPAGTSAIFGPFRLRPAERLLLRGEDPVAIGSRALDILIALVEAAGQVVSQKELVARAWPNVVVGEGSLRVTIAELRKLLGDGQDGIRYIANVTGRGYCFVAAIAQCAAGASTPPAPGRDAANPHKLPSRLARMVGRDEVVESLSDLLTSKRFVSIVGPGGMGKTTVAISLAHRLLEAFPGATYFVDLGALTAPELVANAIATELGVHVTTANAMPGVIAFLAHRKALLVLDNCEHVIDAAASLAEQIFNETEQVHILTTSREVLRVEGEQVYLLSPLDYPGGPCLTAKEAMASPAVQLFMDRAFASGHASPLSDAEAAVVAAICGRLDGIALAIELAGSRVGAYGLQGTADLLSNRFKLFWQGRRSAPPRHQTLHAMLDWSYNLLSERNRRVLARLSVFVGVFTLESAQAVARCPQISEEDVACSVADLVDKSLIFITFSQDVPSYRLLDPTSAFAAEKLAQQTDARGFARQHALYFAQWCAAAAPDDHHLMLGRGLSSAFDLPIGNIRAALEWSFSSDGDSEIGVRLAATATTFFFGLSSLGECRRWCEAALAVLPATSLGDRVRLTLQAALAAMADELGEKWHQLHLLAGLNIFHVRSGDADAALAAADRAALLATEIGSPEARAMADFMFGISHHVGGNQPATRLHCERGLAVAAGLRSTQMVFFGHDQRIRGLQVFARALWLTGLPDQAAVTAQSAVDEAIAQNHPVIFCMTLIYSITVFLWNGDLDHAATLIDQLVEHASAHLLRPYHHVGLALSGELRVRLGDVEGGLVLLKRALALLEDQHYYTLGAAIFIAIVEGLIISGQDAEAAAWLEAAFSRPYVTKNNKYVPELLRLRGDLHQRSGEQALLAEEAFQRALDMAGAHSSLSFELRSATSLARLWASTGREGEAGRLLREVYARFTEGFETHDLRIARQLLEGLPRVG
jgi:predicted ATPase/DNA-binding winged helix-turn-helix (wHTH) protein